MVDMCIHPEKALEHSPYHIQEVWREWNTILLWEHSRIIHLQSAELFTHLPGGRHELTISCMTEAFWQDCASVVRACIGVSTVAAAHTSVLLLHTQLLIEAEQG